MFLCIKMSYLFCEFVIWDKILITFIFHLWGHYSANNKPVQRKVDFRGVCFSSHFIRLQWHRYIRLYGSKHYGYLPRFSTSYSGSSLNKNNSRLLVKEKFLMHLLRKRQLELKWKILVVCDKIMLSFKLTTMWYPN